MEFLRLGILAIIGVILGPRGVHAFLHLPQTKGLDRRHHPSDVIGRSRSSLSPASSLYSTSQILEPPSTTTSTSSTPLKLNVIDVNRRGEEGHLPVIILHGLLGSGRNFRSWATALHERLEKPRRVLVPDLRNHGSSAHAPGMTYR